jgi:type IV pilus assembly protein PilE
MYYKKDKGFTIIELIITIIIVAILAFVGVPVYRNYVKEGYITEGKSLLGEINAAQQIYYSRHGQFYVGTAGTSLSSAFGVDARRNKYFTSYTQTIDGDSYTTTISGSGPATGITLTLEGSVSGTPRIIEDRGSD